MKEFKVGDKVWSIFFGNGEVINGGNLISKDYPVLVMFEIESSHAISHTIDGKASIYHVSQTLYHGHDLEFIVKEPEYEYEYQYLIQESNEKSYFYTSGHYKTENIMRERCEVKHNNFTRIEESKRKVEK